MSFWHQNPFDEQPDPFENEAMLIGLLRTLQFFVFGLALLLLAMVW